MLGICQIDIAPQSIEATFTGRQETFQFTKVMMIVAFFYEALMRAPCHFKQYTQGLFCQHSHEDNIALICIQLQSGCNARRLLNHGKFRTQAPIFTPGKKNSHSTSARFGMSLETNSC
jgi:hypothetical protein